MKVIHASTAFTSQYSSAENSDSACAGRLCSVYRHACVSDSRDHKHAAGIRGNAESRAILWGLGHIQHVAMYIATSQVDACRLFRGVRAAGALPAARRPRWRGAPPSGLALSGAPHRTRTRGPPPGGQRAGRPGCQACVMAAWRPERAPEKLFCPGTLVQNQVHV